MAARYVRLAEGFLPVTAKLLKISDGAADAEVIATGTPQAIRELARSLNGEAPASESQDG